MALPEPFRAAAGGENRHPVEKGRNRPHHGRIGEGGSALFDDGGDLLLDLRRGRIDIRVEVAGPEEGRRLLGHGNGHRAGDAGDHDLDPGEKLLHALRRKGARLGGVAADHLRIRRRLLHAVVKMDLLEARLMESLGQAVARASETDESDLHRLSSRRYQRSTV